MSRGLKILIAALAALAVLLAINTIVVDNETKEAEPTIEGGEILSLPGGDVQVLDEGAAAGDDAPPIVLVHCYSCSLHWWDRLAPILAERHRVIRIDLLGHGGSQKPSGGYEIPEQAALVAGALDQLGVDGAVVVGHSMGFAVATALAAQSSQLVDRLVNIGLGPSTDTCSLPFLARMGYVPVIGEAIRRLAPRFAIERSYGSAFAPGFEIEAGFPNPDQVIDDYEAMTFTSYVESSEATDDYREEVPLDDRLRQIPVPLLSIFGEEDQICDAGPAQEAYGEVPGARTASLPDIGHSPNVEAPEETAALIEEFATEAGDESAPPRPRGRGDRQRGG